MAEAKTKVNAASVEDFLNTIDAQVREDCKAISQMMEKATGAPPEMWGANIVGFGRRPILYANGKTQDWPIIGFSPRKQNITLYVSIGRLEGGDELLAKLGKHSCGKGCLYIKKLSEVDSSVLNELIVVSANRPPATD